MRMLSLPVWLKIERLAGRLSFESGGGSGCYEWVGELEERYAIVRGID